jgi:2-iminobutanoate/2-iminopropanoate deaminase
VNTKRRQTIHLPKIAHRAPIPHGARVGPLLCSSALTGRHPQTGELPADAQQQIAHAFANLDDFLAAGGATRDDVVKLSITLSEEADRDRVNPHWLERWPDANDRPARHVAIAPLAHGQRVQLELMAYVAGG